MKAAYEQTAANANETETRKIIDEQLRKVGWQADTQTLRYANGARPAKGENRIIAEWPTKHFGNGKGFADYAVFIGLRLVGFIEAKRSRKKLMGTLDNQAKAYAKNVREEDAVFLEGQWGDYKVPFVFAANGKPYNEKFKEDSGIWFQDLRNPANQPYPLQGWFSPQALEERLKADISTANANLINMSSDFLTAKDGLNLRDYQIDAINAVEKSILNGKRKIMVAMATGTGKTRTTLGLIYKLLKSGRSRRILFLVDRTALGEQALDAFNGVRLEQGYSLGQIFSILGMETRHIASETRVHVSTVQAMMRRILAPDAEEMPSAGDYDTIIVDEAHRGYTLDKKMSDEEELYRDEKDFISKYKKVIDYFDAVKIGLTATPALHTVSIFDEPVMTYSYQEAVRDGYLAAYDPPHQIKTLLNTEGLHHHKGEEVDVLDTQTGEVTQKILEDELNFDVDDFNKKVIVKSFNEAVLKEIAYDIAPEDEDDGKTLIFAVNDNHADMITGILQDIYTAQEVPADAIKKITGSIGDSKVVSEAIRQFKYDKYPSIVVTVDLLTTGVDVPKITKLVFMRRVKSRILFEQMLGRGTRLCKEIGKTSFEVYDAVGAFDVIGSVTDMKPATAKPAAAFADIVKAIQTLGEPEAIKGQVQELVKKFNRRRKKFTKNQETQFKERTGQTPKDFINNLNTLPVDEAVKLIEAHAELIVLLDQEGEISLEPVIISDKPDTLIAHERGYGKGNLPPEDYLMAFSKFVRENPEHLEAISIICTRPRDLTLKALKELDSSLRQQGFVTEHLNGAFNETRLPKTHEKITANIVGLIRTYALNIPLVDHEKRVDMTIKTILSQCKYNKTQTRWIERFGSILKENSVLSIEVLNVHEGVNSRGGVPKLQKNFDDALEELIDQINTVFYDMGSVA